MKKPHIFRAVTFIVVVAGVIGCSDEASTTLNRVGASYEVVEPAVLATSQSTGEQIEMEISEVAGGVVTIE